MNRVLFFLLVLFLASLGACKNDGADEYENVAYKVVQDKDLAASLKTAPETVEAGGLLFHITTSLWRDFMPVSPPDGREMIGVINLEDIAAKYIPHEVQLKQLYVVYGDLVWIVRYSEIKRVSDFSIEGTVRNGPKWGPNVLVDVVCEFEYQGVKHMVLAKSQLIVKTS